MAATRTWTKGDTLNTRTRACAAGLLALSLAAGAAPALATVAYADEVDGQVSQAVERKIAIESADGTMRDGSWSDIKDAIAEANAGDTIVLPAGTFEISPDNDYKIPKAVSFKGSGAGQTVIEGQVFYSNYTHEGAFAPSDTISISDLTVRYNKEVNSGADTGILMPASDVTALSVTDVEIEGFLFGISLNTNAESCAVTASGLKLTNVWCGIGIDEQKGNKVSSFDVTADSDVVYAVQGWSNSHNGYYPTYDSYTEDDSHSNNNGNESGFTKPSQGQTYDYVATVGDTRYSDLQDALDNAQVGATIHLAAGEIDAPYSENNGGVYTFGISKSVTIVGSDEGTTIKGAIWTDNTSSIDMLKIENISFVHNESDAKGSQGICIRTNVSNTYINNCSFNGYQYAVGNGGATGNLYINNATMSNVWCGVGFYEGASGTNNLSLSLADGSDLVYEVQSFGTQALPDGYYPTFDEYDADKKTGDLGANAIPGSSVYETRPEIGESINVVATVNGHNFDNLQVAVDYAVKNEAEVNLVDDVTITKSIQVSEGAKLTVNGNDKTTTVQNDNPNAGVGVFNNTSRSPEGLAGATEITVNNVNFVGDESEQNNYAAIVGAADGVKVTFADCGFKNMYTAVYCNPITDPNAAKTSISITGSTFDNVKSAYSVDDYSAAGSLVGMQDVTLENNTNQPEPETFAVASVGGVGYPTLDAAIDAADKLDEDADRTVTLQKDVEVDKQLELGVKGMTLDLNGKTITASEDFTYSMSNKNDAHVVNISASGVTIENGTIKATEKNKHALNVYGCDGVTIRDMVLDHTESATGAPLVVAASDVTVEGELELVTGKGSWYGADVDSRKIGDVATSASLTLAGGASIVVTGSTESSLGVYVENTALSEADTTVSFGSGTSISSPDIDGFIPVKIAESTEGVVENPGNAGLVAGEDGTFVEKPEPSVPSGPSTPSAPTYDVTVSETEGGKVTLSDSTPEEGDVVTVTATPDEGKLAWSVTVTDEDGNAVEAKRGEKDGTWTFEMPEGDVTVAVRFVCDGKTDCPSSGLVDVEVGAWYHDVVDWAVETGAMTGHADGSGRFAPDAALTRAQLAAVLYRAAGEPSADVSGLSAYSDCDEDAWYAESVAWATSEGLMTGYDDGTGRFAPDAELTREQLAAVYWRLAGEPAADADLSAFPDGSETSAWATDPVEWAVSTGLLRGNDQTGELDPAGDLTRAQMAAVLYRLANE